MWSWKLACIAFQIVVLGNESCACGSCVYEHIRIGASTETNIVSVFRFEAVGAKMLDKPFIYQEAPTTRTTNWLHRLPWN